MRQFYEWYINADKGTTPAEDSADMYRFVAKGTADRIREDIRRGSLPGNVAYFTKVQDYDPAEWLLSINIHPALTLAKDSSIVGVTFGKNEKVNIVLFLKEEGDRWKIIKADDTLPYP